MNEIIFSNTSMPVLTGCDLMAASEPFYHADRVLDFNVLIYVTDGTIYVTEDETDHAVGEGELLFLKYGHHHYGKHEIARGTRWYYIHFYFTDDENADEIMPDASPVGQYSPMRYSAFLPKKLTGLKGSDIEKKIMNLTDYIHSSDGFKRWNVNAKLWKLLGSIAVYERTIPEEKSLSDRICAYLSEHYAEKFSSKTLEKEFYLSYKHMAAVFRKEKETTMQQYHNSIRMEEACRLLRSTMLTVGEISDRTGFQDMLYFSRCFHAYMGCSPTDYRKSIREKY